MNNNLKKETILEQLTAYSKSDYYPFHMPGHKRNLEAEKELAQMFPDPFSIDITEISGFDDLHHPEGILRFSMERTARIYGADASFYLINGSSGGILAAISGCVKRGGKILVSRNCHKSVYHGIYLNDLWAEYVYPQYIDELGINGGILPKDVETVLKECPDIQAVLIVSPTYDGIVSDIQAIADAAHARGIPLIVDEAHGAHLPFGKGKDFPVSALECGADVVIQSLHKTLPSFTQTAILHLKSKFLGQEKMERIRFFLSVYQSSSPSYIFMAAAEQCVLYMHDQGRKRLSGLAEELKQFRKRAEILTDLRIPGKEIKGKNGVYDLDLSRILISGRVGGKSGAWIAEKLRSEYHLEMEMCAPWYCVALTSVWDRKEGFERLFHALKKIDEEIKQERGQNNLSAVREQIMLQNENSWNREIGNPAYCSIFQAGEIPSRKMPLEKSAGFAAADYIYLYPPGIPCLVPGEMITGEMIQKILWYIQMGFSVHGLYDEGKINIKVLGTEAGASGRNAG